MTTKPAPRIDAYIAGAAAYAQPILRHLRALVRRACPEATETIKWGMPFFEYHGLLCNMAAFKAHCAFGFHHQGMDAVLAKTGYQSAEAMGNLGRITSLDDLPAEAVLRRYIQQAAQLNASGAPRRLTAKPRPAPKVPAELTAALKTNAAAAANFAQLAPSHRREYIEWITEAKRPETRAKRLATTVEWVAKGKARNWKYRDC
jgi:uncharacterized protein YdeI (YjbR/CyaY-like superfamily)